MAGKGEVKVIHEGGVRILYKCPCGGIMEFLRLGGREICPGCGDEYRAKVLIGCTKRQRVSPA